MRSSVQLQGTLATARLATLKPASTSLRVGIPALQRPAGRKALGAPRKSVAVQASLEDGVERAFSAAADSVPSLLDHVAAALTTALVMADADPAAAADAVVDAAAAAKKGGFFSIFTDTFETFLKSIDSALYAAHVPYSYGFAIITITLLVKLATFPLSKKQVESTLSMQALQPRVKGLQAKFANDPERLQVETAKLYQTAGVNPLAGCLPTLATIPVFIGLYRALSNVADEGLLTEGFFWIPSLAGPTKLNGGLSWLTSFQDGAPPMGWGDTARYLLLPVLLVISQYASQKIISPQQSTDPAQQQSQAILKFIPFMIGWFALSVPSGLTLYWFTNNLLTTAQQVYLRRQFDSTAAAAAGTVDGAGVIDVEGTYVAPKAAEEEKRITGKELGSRRSKQQVEFLGDGSASESASSRGERFRSIKAREAAAKAAVKAVGEGSNGTSNGAAAEAASAAASTVMTMQQEEEEVSVPDAPPAKDGFAAAVNGSAGKAAAKKKKASKKK